MIARAAIDVLIVEDNEINQQVVSMTLDMAGFSYRIAPTGREAVAAWRAFSPRLILMDIAMPEMNGWDATAAIRAEEEGTGRRVPIIALTAHAMTGDREKCLAVGMDDYMQKPIMPDTLIARVGALIGAEAEARQLSA
ncbi:MAG: response regulator [Brucellaceae bacterium]|nr:response regulator [Brucellaceae bacterium]